MFSVAATVHYYFYLNVKQSYEDIRTRNFRQNGCFLCNSSHRYQQSNVKNILLNHSFHQCPVLNNSKIVIFENPTNVTVSLKSNINYKKKSKQKYAYENGYNTPRGQILYIRYISFSVTT